MIESGLTKICAIGLGQYDGAREIHRHIFDVGLGETIRGVTEKVLSTGQIVSSKPSSTSITPRLSTKISSTEGDIMKRW